MIKPGQIWKEIDPRFDRYVEVKTVLGGLRRSIGIRTVVPDKIFGWIDAPRSRLSYADANRFANKRGGYSLRVDVA